MATVTSAILMATTIVVIAGVLRRWKDLLIIKQLVQGNWGDTVIAPIEGEALCSARQF